MILSRKSRRSVTLVTDLLPSSPENLAVRVDLRVLVVSAIVGDHPDVNVRVTARLADVKMWVIDLTLCQPPQILDTLRILI